MPLQHLGTFGSALTGCGCGPRRALVCACFLQFSRLVAVSDCYFDLIVVESVLSARTLVFQVHLS